MDYRLINVQELADKLGSTVSTIYSWVSMHRIPSDCIVRIHRSLRFDAAAVDKWIDTQRQRNI